MFDIGFQEIVVICVVALVVVGPERLPGLARNIGIWLGRARRYAAHVRADFEREVGASQVRELIKSEDNTLGQAVKAIQETKQELTQATKDMGKGRQIFDQASKAMGEDQTIGTKSTAPDSIAVKDPPVAESAAGQPTPTAAGNMPTEMIISNQSQPGAVPAIGDDVVGRDEQRTEN